MKIKILIIAYAIFLILYAIIVIKIHHTISLDCIEDNPGCEIKKGFVK